MCGVTGFWAPPASGESFAPVLERMIHSMRHRGPDSSGVWHDENAGIGLGHARLAIVDLSPGGAQPMRSPDGRYTICYNGEVYNFPAIRQELEDAGMAPQWNGASDTEVMLAAFQAWPFEEALERFIGMFAFALWDAHEQTLTLSRDRLGIKPMYFGFQQDTLLFGSELKPLREHPSWRGGLDFTALGAYFQRAYVPAPYSIYKDVFKLLPGAYVRFNREDLKARRIPVVKRYWRLEERALEGLAVPFEGSESEVADELERLLSDAVGLRMVADVPLGAFLSGGIDSSTVVALMQAQSSSPVRTFSIGSRSKDYDEAHEAVKVARHLGTQHTELYVEPEEAQKVIPQLPVMYDEPYADYSQIPTYLVSKLAREQVTVSLSGDGGDELFGGYNRYLQAPRLWRNMQRLPRPMRKSIALAMQHGGEAILGNAYLLAEPLLPAKKRIPLFRDKLQKISNALPASTPTDIFYSLTSYWRSQEDILNDGPSPIPLLGTGAPASPFQVHPAQPDVPDTVAPFASWMMGADQHTYLPDDILTKLDRASMAVSLEGRVPLLDHRVVEFAWRTPLEMKLGRAGGIGKRILRQVLYRHVPRELVDRPKQGFDVPLDKWLQGPLQDWGADLLSERRIREQGVLNPKTVTKAWKAHQSGKRNMIDQLWITLMFQAWVDEYGI